MGEGANFGQGNLGNDTVVAAAAAGPRILLGGQGDDIVRGGDAADFVNGNLGADSLVGGGGADTLHVEGAVDALSGDAGADILDGGEGADVFQVAAGSSGVTELDADRILNWSSEDLIDVPGFGGPGAYYMIPADYLGGGG